MKLPIPGGRRAILVIGVPLGLAAAGAFAFTTLSAPAKAAPKVSDPVAGQVGPILALDSRVINLTMTNGGTYKYAKIGVSIELRPSTQSFYDAHGTERTKLETTELQKYNADVPLLLDALGTTVSAHDSTTLTTSDGRGKLKAELLIAFQKILGADNVLDIYFTDFVMQ